MAIVKMKFVGVSTDEKHTDQMLLAGVNSGMLHAENASKIINEDNNGKLISDDDPYSGYCQTLSNIAHSLNYTIQVKDQPSKEYSAEEIESFIEKMNQLFGLTTDAKKVILTPDDS